MAVNLSLVCVVYISVCIHLHLYPNQVHYRKGPHMQNSMHKLKLTLTLTNTGGAVLTVMLGYRSLYITWQ